MLAVWCLFGLMLLTWAAAVWATYAEEEDDQHTVAPSGSSRLKAA